MISSYDRQEKRPNSIVSEKNLYIYTIEIVVRNVANNIHGLVK